MKFRSLILLILLTSLVAVMPAAAEDTVCADGERLIVHDLGETCVPEGVERVVTIEHSMTEAVVTLGVQPVGVSEISLYNALVNLSIPLSEEAVDVGSRREPNLEVIAGLNPDLIVAASFRVAAIYEQLSAIAPTITYGGSGSLEMMEDYFSSIAYALNREEYVEQVLEDMYLHFEEAAELIADSDVSTDFVLSLTWYANDLASFRLYTDNAFPVEILSQIGLVNKWDGEPNEDGFTLVGIESLGEISDVNFLFITDEDSAPFYAESELWNSLPFVQDETVYRLNDDLWLYGGPLSAQRLVDAVLLAFGLIEPEPEVEEVEVEAEATAEVEE